MTFRTFALTVLATVCVVTPAFADDVQDIGIVASVDRIHRSFSCDCASNTLADMSTARRHANTYRTTAQTEFSVRRPFPHGEEEGTFAKVVTGKSAIVDYHLVGGVRVVDDVTILSEDCRPKFCGP